MQVVNDLMVESRHNGIFFFIKFVIIHFVCLDEKKKKKKKINLNVYFEKPGFFFLFFFFFFKILQIVF